MATHSKKLVLFYTDMGKVRKYWFEIFITIAVVLSLFSCDIQKRAIKDKQDRVAIELQERTFTRLGDTVRYTVPKITYRDTTIYTVNRQGTTLRTVYNDSGQLSQIDCISSLIEVTERLERTLEEQIKSKNKEKEENFDSSVILYLVFGVVIMFLILIFFAYKYLNQNKKLLTELVSRV